MRVGHKERRRDGVQCQALYSMHFVEGKETVVSLYEYNHLWGEKGTVGSPPWPCLLWLLYGPKFVHSFWRKSYGTAYPSTNLSKGFIV